MKKNKIEIYINGKKKVVDHNLNINKLLRILSIKSVLIAIEINKETIPRSQHKTKIIKDNDEVEILELIGGG